MREKKRNRGEYDLLDTLGYIAEKLNAEKIVWAVGASLLLNRFALIDKPNDIDILVHLKDVEKADGILKSIGEKIEAKKETTYATKFFNEYVINGIDVDLMSGLTINHQAGAFQYIFDNDSISDVWQVNGSEIPLTTLEDWYILYQLIPKREAKVKIIEEYLMVNGIRHSNLLKRALDLNLPDEVRENIQRMLN